MSAQALADLTNRADLGFDRLPARDHVERLASRFDVRGEELRDLLGTAGRTPLLEPLVRNSVEVLHCRRDISTSLVGLRSDSAPDVERVVPLNRLSTGFARCSLHLFDRLRVPRCRHPDPEPAI